MPRECAGRFLLSTSYFILVVNPDFLGSPTVAPFLNVAPQRNGTDRDKGDETENGDGLKQRIESRE